MHSIFIHVIIYRGEEGKKRKQSMEVNKQINIKTQTNVNSELGTNKTVQPDLGKQRQRFN